VRTQPELRPDDTGLEPEVQTDRHERVLETGHHGELVREGVLATAQPAQLLGERIGLRLCDVSDQEHLEGRAFPLAGR
jgi:hypothetical protein